MASSCGVTSNGPTTSVEVFNQFAFGDDASDLFEAELTALTDQTFAA